MPLKENAENPAGKPVQDFMDLMRKDRIPHDPTSRTNTPSHQPDVSRSRHDSVASNDEALSNPIGARDVSLTKNEKLQKAKAMKMNLPNTTGSKDIIAGNNLFATAPDRENRRPIAPSRTKTISMRTDQRPTFDDTTSLTIDYESSLQDDEQNTTVFRGFQADLQHNNAVTGLSEYNQKIAFARTNGAANIQDFLPNNWPELSRQEQMLQQQEQKFKNRDTVRSVEIGHQEIEEQRPALSDTPSRVHTAPPGQHARPAPSVKTVTFFRDKASSPELELPNAKVTGRPASYIQPTRQATEKSKFTQSAQPVPRDQGTAKAPFSHSFSDLHGKDRVLAKPSPINIINSARASDYPTSSSDDEPRQSRTKSPTPPSTAQNDHNARKRQRGEDMDYDVAILKTMKYDDLHKQKYHEDPRNHNQGHVLYQQNTLSSHTQQFNDLHKMTEDDQRIMFRNQNDEEWTQMGSWFIDQFQESLKKLVQIRIERRKISLKFENEIRRRQKDVEQCSAGVEEELRDLKRGGGELIRGRDAPSRIGTPQKR